MQREGEERERETKEGCVITNGKKEAKNSRAIAISERREHELSNERIYCAKGYSNHCDSTSPDGKTGKDAESAGAGSSESFFAASG
jgi:hypothetical protein